MKTITHHAFNNETIYVTFQLNTKEFKSLSDYMHAKEGSGEIWFPHGVALIKRGYGWYRLLANNGVRGVEKIQFAMKIIMRWYKDEEAKTVEAIKQLMPAILSETRIVAFSAAHSEGELTYAGATHAVDHKKHVTASGNEPPKPVDPNRLLRLATVFNNKHSNRHSRG